MGEEGGGLVGPFPPSKGFILFFLFFFGCYTSSSFVTMLVSRGLRVCEVNLVTKELCP